MAEPFCEWRAKYSSWVLPTVSPELSGGHVTETPGLANQTTLIELVECVRTKVPASSGCRIQKSHLNIYGTAQGSYMTVYSCGSKLFGTKSAKQVSIQRK